MDHKIKNYSRKPISIDFDIRKIKEIVFLPDYCRSTKGALPVGSVAVYDKNRHVLNPAYLGTDVGCGMRLSELENVTAEEIPELTNIMAEYFLNHPKGLGSLGKGNHFLTFYKSGEKICALIHSGSREKGIELFKRNLRGDLYFQEHEKVREYAQQNRATIQKRLEDLTGKKTKTILDSSHNFVEVNGEEIIYRKGATKVMAGELHIIPSSMGGDAIIVRGNHQLVDLRNSLPHGTGRKMSISKAREQMFFEDPDTMKDVYFPYFLSLESVSTSLPQCFRNIEETNMILGQYYNIIETLSPVASLMI